MENNHPSKPASAQRFLWLLKMRGPQTVTELAKELHLTGEAVRLQLIKMNKEGLVKAAASAKGVGRPVQMWSLTKKGHNRFPDAHAELSMQLITTIRNSLGPGVLDNLIKVREKTARKRYDSELKKISSLKERLSKLVAIRNQEGYLAEWQKDKDGYLLIENHCPICSAATFCGSLCQSELKTFQEVLGKDVFVQRMDHIISGDRRCLYKITPL